MKFRASFTILSTWATGNYDNAIRYYFKLETPTTPQMYEGKKLHQEWSDYIEKNKALPSVLGGHRLINPITEKKSVVQLEDWLEFVYKPDLIDLPLLYEFKTGKSSSDIHIRSKQIGCYAAALRLDKQIVKMARVLRYDQYNKKLDVSSVWITDKLLQDSLDWITTISSEMHSYLTDNNLYNKFSNS